MVLFWLHGCLRPRRLRLSIGLRKTEEATSVGWLLPWNVAQACLSLDGSGRFIAMASYCWITKGRRTVEEVQV